MSLLRAPLNQITDAAEIPEIMAKAFISLNQVDQVLF
jgi:hypothetical protein